MSACPSTVGSEAGKAGVAKVAFLTMAETVKASAQSMGLTMVFDTIFCVNWVTPLVSLDSQLPTNVPKKSVSAEATMAGRPANLHIGGSQSECATFSRPYLPPAEALYALEAFMESIGLMFLVVLWPKALRVFRQHLTIN
ncbi:hypothetical protein HDU77_003360 [Chytriomyces hyalinus]|nr:hypothetical protein HDU77_003360 [Chytriomyces hyalinus]